MLHYTGKNKLTGDIDRSLMTMWGQPESFADPVSLTKSLHGQAINSSDDGRVTPGVCCDRVEPFTSLGHDYFLSRGGGGYVYVLNPDGHLVLR